MGVMGGRSPPITPNFLPYLSDFQRDERYKSNLRILVWPEGAWLAFRILLKKLFGE